MTSNKIILATGCDKNYLPRIDRYLKSIEINSNFDENVLVYIGDDLSEINEYSNIKKTKLNMDTIRALNVQINCVQHGEFIKSDFFNDVSDEDIIFFTDGDIYLQRGLYQDEIDFLKKMKTGQVWVGYNAGPNDTLSDEYNRLSPTGNDFIKDIHGIKCYNTGVLCMNKKTWIDLSEKYITMFNLVDKMFNHYAKQQWLISYLLREFEVIEMNYDIHNHNIYGVKHGMSVIGSDVYFNEKKSLFRHKWF